MTTYLERLRARELENVRIRLDDSIEEVETDDNIDLGLDSDDFGIEPYHNED